MKNVITYGTFDLIHYGHIEILRRAKEFTEGGELIVAVSSDEFNKVKGKKSHQPYKKRKENIEAIRYVDRVISENNWEQKETDIINHGVDIFIIGDDWKGKFDHLEAICRVVYLPRTPSISSSVIKKIIAEF